MLEMTLFGPEQTFIIGAQLEVYSSYIKAHPSLSHESPDDIFCALIAPASGNRNAITHASHHTASHRELPECFTHRWTSACDPMTTRS